MEKSPAWSTFSIGLTPIKSSTSRYRYSFVCFIMNSTNKFRYIWTPIIQQKKYEIEIKHN